MIGRRHKKGRVVNRLKSSISFNSGYKAPTADPVKARAKKEVRRQNKARVEAILFVGLLLLVMFLGFRLSPDPVINIDDKQFSRTAAQGVENKIRVNVKEVISSSLFKRVKIFTPRDEILDAVKSLPEVKDAGLVISRSGQRPIINVELHDVAAVYTVAGSSYLLSGEGKVISRQDSLAQKSGLPVIEDKLLGIDNIEFSKPVVSTSNLNSIISLDALFKAKQGSGGLIDFNVYQLNQNPGEIVAIADSSGRSVLFFAGNDVLEQGASYIKFTSSESPESLSLTKYIDARVAGRIIYR